MASNKSDWQRTYDESLAREAARTDDGMTDGEAAAQQASSLLPGWLGFAGFVVTTLAFVWKRRQRRV